MSINQYAFPFKHVSPSEYATTRPLIVSSIGKAWEKPALRAMRTSIEAKAIAIGRFMLEYYPL
jgi:hypothetical protein